MAKNIVVCSDGTGNSAIKDRGTNVFKTFEAIDLTGHRSDPGLTPQIALYDDGVGTEDLKPLRLFAGMTGYGLSRNVRQLYKELVRVYDPGDRLYFFGFSRGAFTVRSLAGFIATCGLLDPKKLRTTQELDDAVADAYRLYRRNCRSPLHRFLGRWWDRDEARAAHQQRCHDGEVRIRFIGVWDTVDAVGLPFHLADVINATVYRFKFPDHRLSPIVDRGCHALAIDDERHSFHPLVWDERDEENGRIEQVWFAGAHSNVGGGYPKQGMSLVALDWMMAGAERAGLRFIADDRHFYGEHTNVDDKLYDPRAGLGVFYRWKLRNIENICRLNGVVPKLHLGVLERIAHGTDDYAPGNLPRGAKVVFTDPTDHRRAALAHRAETLEAALRTAQEGTEPLLTTVKVPARIGLASYYVYLATCTLVLLAAANSGHIFSELNPWVLLKSTIGLVLGAATRPFGTGVRILKTLAGNPPLLACLAGGFVVSYLLAHFADARMSAVFSAFWHKVQPALRDALKQANRALRESEPSEPVRKSA